VDGTSSPILVILGSGVSRIKVKRWKVKILTHNISKTVTDTRLDPWEHLVVGPTGYRLAPSHLTLDYLEGSQIKVILFDVKYIKNGNSYDGWPSEVKGQGHKPGVTSIGMWGYTPVRTTGVLVCLFFVNEILQDGRSRSPPGLLPFWWTFAQGLAPQGPKSEKLW